MSTDSIPEPSEYYVVQFQTTYRSLDDAARADPELISAHVAHSAEMHAQGELLMAGAFLDEPDSQQLVNGQVTVAAGGQEKVPAPRVDQVLFKVVPPLARAWRMR